MCERVWRQRVREAHFAAYPGRVASTGSVTDMGDGEASVGQGSPGREKPGEAGPRLLPKPRVHSSQRPRQGAREMHPHHQADGALGHGRPLVLLRPGLVVAMSLPERRTSRPQGRLPKGRQEGRVWAPKGPLLLTQFPTSEAQGLKKGFVCWDGTPQPRMERKVPCDNDATTGLCAGKFWTLPAKSRARGGGGGDSEWLWSLLWGADKYPATRAR